MTAPIVEDEVRSGVCMGCGGAVLNSGEHIDEDRHVPSSAGGQLWERLREADVLTHGEPTPQRLFTPIEVMFGALAEPDEVRRQMAAQIEERRPAMRERRRCSTCNGEGSIPVMDPFGYETLYDCGECDGGLRVG